MNASEALQLEWKVVHKAPSAPRLYRANAGSRAKLGLGWGVQTPGPALSGPTPRKCGCAWFCALLICSQWRRRFLPPPRWATTPALGGVMTGRGGGMTRPPAPDGLDPYAPHRACPHSCTLTYGGARVISKYTPDYYLLGKIQF